MQSAPSPPDPNLLHRIPLSAQTILDAGCGDGTLAAAYRQMNPRARLIGIDADPIAVERAKQHLDEAAALDIEAAEPPFDLSHGVDCIIYDQVLERLRDPWGLVRRHVDWLTPNGMMLIRLANPEHWRIAEHLLRGVWDEKSPPPAPAAPYLFNLDRARAALLDAGLTLCDVTLCEEDSDSDAARRFVDAITPGLIALGADPKGYAQRSTPTFFIWRVRKLPAERMILSGNMLDPVGGVSHVRVVNPLAAIGSDPLLSVAVTKRLETEKPSHDIPRIFVLHRPALTAQGGSEKLRALEDAGYLVVTEFDDHPDFFQMMQFGGELSFRGVHAVQTSTPALAEVMRKYNPEVAVFPNAMPVLPTVRNFRDSQALTLFFGALNREDCWRPLMPVLNRVAAAAGGRLRFQVVHDMRFFEALETKHKSFTPTCDYDTYLDLLGTSEICYMPLSDTPFNRAKSDLKFIESGACRVAALASTVVYSDSIQDGQTGLLFRDDTELYDRLMRLIAMPELARDLATAARHYVARERMLAYQVAPRIAWYRSLWRRRATLQAALRERMTGEWLFAA